MVEDTLRQLVVEDADAARLDHDVRGAGFGEDACAGLRGCFVDDRMGVSGRIDVAMLLPLEGVGFVEGDVVTSRGKVAQEAAVIGGGTVPV